MPKRVVLHLHLTPQDLKQQYLTRPDRVEARRCHLLWLVATDFNIKDAARVVGYSYDYAKDLVRNYNDLGVAAIRNLRRDCHPPGRTPLLNEEQILALQTALQHPPAGGGMLDGGKSSQMDDRKYRSQGGEIPTRLGLPPPSPISPDSPPKFGLNYSDRSRSSEAGRWVDDSPHYYPSTSPRLTRFGQGIRADDLPQIYPERSPHKLGAMGTIFAIWILLLAS